MQKQKDKAIDMLQGTLDLLILRTLLFGPIHGHAIAKSIERTSQDVLRVEQLTSETSKWERLSEAIARILNPNREEA
jgi:DNA-binding HxlR family transcriptional regulator